MTDARAILEQALCFHDACPECVKAGRCLSAQLAHEDWGEDVAAQLAALAEAGLEIVPHVPAAGMSEPGRELLRSMQDYGVLLIDPKEPGP